MIKCENGLVTIRGEKTHIAAEYMVITRKMIEVFGEENVDFFIKNAKMTDEELDNEAKKSMRKMFDSLFDTIFKQEEN